MNEDEKRKGKKKKKKEMGDLLSLQYGLRSSVLTTRKLLVVPTEKSEFVWLKNMEVISSLFLMTSVLGSLLPFGAWSVFSPPPPPPPPPPGMKEYTYDIIDENILFF